MNRDRKMKYKYKIALNGKILGVIEYGEEK